MHIAQADHAAELEAPSVGVMPFLVMMAGLASQSMVFSLLPALLPFMARDFGTNGPFITQMFYAGASFGLVVTSIASGAVVRAIGVRMLLIVSATLFGVAGLVPWLTANVPLLLASRLVLGGSCGLLTTGCTMLLAHSYRGGARSKALGYQTAIGSALGLGCMLIGGASVSRFGWHPVFLLFGLFAFPVAILSIIGVPQVPLPAQSPGRGFGEAFLRIWPVCIAAGLLMMVALLVGSETPFILAAIHVTSPSTQSLLISLATIFSVISGAVFGQIQSVLGVRQTFASSLFLAGAGMACIGVSTAGWMAGLGCGLVGLGLGVYIPHLWVLATNLVAESIRGHAVGLLTTSMYIGGFLYPFIVGQLEKITGLGGAFVTIAALLVVAAAGIQVFKRSRLAGATMATLP